MRLAKATSASGVLLLRVSFFLPQVRGCHEDVLRVLYTADSHGSFLIGWGLPFLSALVAAPVLGLRWLARSEKVQKWVARILCGFAALILAFSTWLLAAA